MRLLLAVTRQRQTVWGVAPLPPMRSGMRGCFGWRNFDQLKREFSGSLRGDANVPAGFESGLIEPVSAQADFWLDAAFPKVAAGFNLEGALIVLRHLIEKYGRSLPLSR